MAHTPPSPSVVRYSRAMSRSRETTAPIRALLEGGRTGVCAPRTRLRLALVVLATTLLGAPGPVGTAHAAGDAGFTHFCGEWLSKLQARERQNLQKAEPRRRESEVILEYVGYARSFLLCDARPAGQNGNWLGRLAYQELLYRRSGNSRQAALANKPQVVQRVKVTEIFRYDGSRWRY